MTVQTISASTRVILNDILKAPMMSDKQGLNRPKHELIPHRLPITPVHLQTKWITSPPSHDGVMLWAAACTVFLGFLQAGEFTVLWSYLAKRGPAPGPLFVFNSGTPLTRTALVDHLHQVLQQSAFEPNLYNGHSFSNWSRKNCGKSWYRGLPDTDFRQMEKRSLPSVHKDPPLTSGLHFLGIAKRPPLKLMHH